MRQGKSALCDNWNIMLSLDHRYGPRYDVTYHLDIALRD